MSLKDLGNKALQGVLNGGASTAFFNIFQGRCTFFACVFSAVGVYGWLILGRDLTSYALFVGAIQALLVVHSWKEDLMERLDAVKAIMHKGDSK